MASAAGSVSSDPRMGVMIDFVLWRDIVLAKRRDAHEAELCRQREQFMSLLLQEFRL